MDKNLAQLAKIIGELIAQQWVKTRTSTPLKPTHGSVKKPKTEPRDHYKQN